MKIKKIIISKKPLYFYAWAILLEFKNDNPVIVTAKKRYMPQVEFLVECMLKTGATQKNVEMKEASIPVIIRDPESGKVLKRKKEKTEVVEVTLVGTDVKQNILEKLHGRSNSE